ncbi:2352_t:CDS:2, partial [Entrophospora sp. SA101]
EPLKYMESDLNSLRGLVEELRTENDILKKSLLIAQDNNNDDNREIYHRDSKLSKLCPISGSKCLVSIWNWTWFNKVTLAYWTVQIATVLIGQDKSN